MKRLFILGTILLLSVSCSHHYKKNYWNKMDANQDGKVDKEEWMAKFNRKDKNGDGVITRDEMKKGKCCKKSCDYKRKKKN